MSSRIAIRAAIVRLSKTIMGRWWCSVCVVGLGGEGPLLGPSHRVQGVRNGRVGVGFKVEVVAPTAHDSSHHLASAN